MLLDLPTLAPRVILQPATHRIERVAHGNGDVLIGLMLADEDLFIRHAQVNPDLVSMSLMTPIGGGFHRYMTTDQCWRELFQFFHMGPDLALKRRQGNEITENDLHRKFHGRHPIEQWRTTDKPGSGLASQA
jgi:hypothetical protein